MQQVSISAPQDGLRPVQMAFCQQQWEYRSTVIPDYWGGKLAAKLLADIGNDGWEIVSASCESHGVFAALFKRPKKEHQ